MKPSLAAWVIVVASAAVAQQPAGGPAGGPAAAPAADAADPAAVAVDLGLTAHERYLAEHGLDAVLAAHLRQQLANTTGPARSQAAERLGRLYVRLLAKAKTSADRLALEDAARELIRTVPDAEAWDLKLDLAKATYLKAEEFAEKHRLRLATDAERAEAERILRAAGPAFEQIAVRAAARIEAAERKQQYSRGDEAERNRRDAEDSRRIRSLARYYAGWTRYYLGLLSGNTSAANEAMIDFGQLLGASPGKAPTIERTQKSLLKYEHVCRAVIGCALANSVRGNDVEAARWLDLLDAADDVPATITGQLLDRRIAIFATARRWTDIEVYVYRHQRSLGQGQTKRLTVPQARLLAVVTLESSDADLSERARQSRRALSQVAIADLIAAGEIGHVVDLTQRFGVELLGDDGFVTRYARALVAFDRARKHHEQVAPEQTQEPATDVQSIELYRRAAELLKDAAQLTDQNQFAPDVAQARMKLGLARYYAAEFPEAAAAFEIAAETLASADAKREALWFAVVALDRAVEAGKLSQVSSRDRVALLFLSKYPKSEQAAKLLLRRASAGVPDEEALAILMAIPPESPLRDAARRESVRLLYQLYRKTKPGSSRDAAGIRFLTIAEETLEFEQRSVMDAAGDGVADAADRLVLRIRQIADVSLALTAPDIDRAGRSLDLLDQLIQAKVVDVTKLRDEIDFRRLQMALARNDWPAALSAHDALRSFDSSFSIAADRAMYRWAKTRFQDAMRPVAAPGPDALTTGDIVAATDAARAASARDLLLFTTRIIARADRAEPFSEGGMALVFDDAGEANAELWRQQKDATARDAAIEGDEKLIAAKRHSLATLTRFARMTEEVGRNADALEAWRQALLVQTPGTDGWFVARVESLRLLSRIDPSRAREVMLQHRALYPDYGPPPHGNALLAIDRELGPILGSRSATPSSTPSKEATPK
jgi:hypothetical protein